MTSIARVAWTERRAPSDRLLLVVDLRTIAGVAVATVLIVVPFATEPLGRLGSPFALLVALPPLALGLAAFGWRDLIASRLVRIRHPLMRLLATYVAWLLTSAVLTLDVAAVAAASVGIAVAGDRDEERRWQLGGAILGANVGSLLLPFSNLTNLVLVSATGIGLAAYVGLAIWPQIAAGAAVGILFVARACRRITGLDQNGVWSIDAQAVKPAGPVDRPARLAGLVAAGGALAAVAIGLGGGNMAVPFAASAGLLAGAAVAIGRLAFRTVIESIPMAGLAVIVIAVVANGQIGLAATAMPRPDGSLGGLLLALVVGSALAAIANNLPAAAFGAVWLARAHPAAVIAFLIGTNVTAVATPHGSVATILARSVGARHGVVTAPRAYLVGAWRYAVIGAVAGVLALALVTR